MHSLLKILSLVLLMMVLAGCSNYTYKPRSKKMMQREKPSVILIDKIIEFRESTNAWPFSKEEFMNGGDKYKKAFDGFPYLTTRFKVIDNNTMTFFFSQHIKDVTLEKQTNITDLNAYGGEVRFYKEKDKFIWKIKMY